MEAAVAFAKALADPTRLRVITALGVQELCVCELCDALEITQSTLSTHLTLLRKAGVVHTRKEGKWIYYGVKAELAPLIRSFLEHFATTAPQQRRFDRDAARVRRRLKLRENGCCNLGFKQLDGKEVI